jgi:hypothetical protein
MWQWNIHMPGRSSKRTANRIFPLAGTSAVSRHSRGPAGSGPMASLVSSTWKKKPWM